MEVSKVVEIKRMGFVQCQGRIKTHRRRKGNVNVTAMAGTKGAAMIVCVRFIIVFGGMLPQNFMMHSIQGMVFDTVRTRYKSYTCHVKGQYGSYCFHRFKSKWNTVTGDLEL